MWISRQMKTVPPTADADLGITTIAGGSAGVVTRGEVRSLPVYGPGGYIWMPESGGTVLVIKGGPGGDAAGRGLHPEPRRKYFFEAGRHHPPAGRCAAGGDADRQRAAVQTLPMRRGGKRVTWRS